MIPAFTFCRRLPPHFQSLYKLSTNTAALDEALKKLNKDPDNLKNTAGKVLTTYRGFDDEGKNKLLMDIAKYCGVRHDALTNAINLYTKNPLMTHEVQAASSPIHFFLLRSIGNHSDGINIVCEMREKLLQLIKNTDDKQVVPLLRRLEESARELLTTWFCLSNLKLNRLTWKSPGDILYKVAEYEAVHPIRGLVDFRTRIGPHRRCYYFTHEAMPREPLVMVHVALMNKIGDSVQEITYGVNNNDDEDEHTTAIYYSITSTQKGLAGIDLGNLLIKQVAAQIIRDLPSVTVHSTLSPIPGFRSWLLRSLKGHSEFEDLINDKTLSLMSVIVGKPLTVQEVSDLLIKALSNEKITMEQLQPLRPILLHLCAKYLYEAKRNGFAVNPVANFHLRNGAELFRLNWQGDTSYRGLNNSLGIMVNYRYFLDRVTKNSLAYTHDKIIAIDPQCMSLFDEDTCFCGEPEGDKGFWIPQPIDYPCSSAYEEWEASVTVYNNHPLQASKFLTSRTFSAKQFDKNCIDLMEVSNSSSITAYSTEKEHVLPSQKSTPMLDQNAEKKLEKRFPQKIKFDEYLNTLKSEQQEYAKQIMHQLKNCEDGKINLPNNKLSNVMVPLPDCLKDCNSSSDYSFNPDLCNLETLFSSSDPVENTELKLPPWSEASSLKEVDTLSKKMRSTQDVFDALGVEGSLGPQFFGQLVAAKLTEINPNNREDLAKTILDLIKVFEQEEPANKRQCLREI